MGAPAWTPEREKELRGHYAAGLSASQIAAEMGLSSRNAVIGKIHRLGIERPVKPKPAAKAASIPKLKPPVKQHLHLGNIAAKVRAGAKERQAGFEEIADKALERYDEIVMAVRGDDPGILFLDRGLFQCATPLPGWEDVPVTEKRVCGRPVKIASRGGQMTPTSHCRDCATIVYVPSTFRDFKDGRVMRGVPA